VAEPIKFRWSVWEASPTVRWAIGDAEVSVTFSCPPIAVTDLPLRKRIAVATGSDDDGCNELQFFLYDGEKEMTVKSSATSLPHCQFAFARELPTGEIEAGVWYEGAPGGCDHAGILDVKTGRLSRLHPIR
jgi:hypothetical protein